MQTLITLACHLALFTTQTLGECSLTAKSAAEFASELGPLLSPGASISFPGSEEFSNVTVRWSNYDSPSFVVGVRVATESDVQQTVKVANTHSLPFLATTGHHGSVITLGALKCGVDINLRQLKSIEIEPNGQIANIQGGVLAKEVTDALWSTGKWSVTAVCECTSLLGPGLGGGHGWNQGRFGLVLDQFIEANVVLGDGSLITVSDKSHSDLFWALRGAGHNFGIVTSLRYKVYDVPKDNTWFVGKYTFTEDKLESLLNVLNGFINGGNQPIELRHWTTFLSDASIDAENVVITVLVVYEGTETAAMPYTKQLAALKPAAITKNNTAYPGIGAIGGFAVSSPACQDTGGDNLLVPIDLERYNTTAHRQAYNLFNDALKSYPALSKSSFLNEGYSVRAVQAIPANSTAYPDRHNNLLLSPAFNFAADSGLGQVVKDTGLAIRKALFEGSGSSQLNTYVNYAVGIETVEDWYGHEQWRIDRLRALKSTYDPGNKFRFYAPIDKP